MFKFILTLALLLFAIFFIGFNLENRTTINLLLFNFENVPVFYLALISFSLGFVSSVPYFLFRKKSVAVSKKQKEVPNPTPASNEINS